ncbi:MULTISPECIES: hypothetical protein [Cyanophyceae]|nr:MULTISPECIES: hypothetical protein [unclassified Trichocoleus]
MKSCVVCGGGDRANRKLAVSDRLLSITLLLGVYPTRPDPLT